MLADVGRLVNSTVDEIIPWLKLRVRITELGPILGSDRCVAGPLGIRVERSKGSLGCGGCFRRNRPVAIGVRKLLRGVVELCGG